MSGISPATVAGMLVELRVKFQSFVAFAEAHEKWEAKALLDESPWFDRMPDELMTGFEELQKLRNKALGR